MMNVTGHADKTTLMDLIEEEDLAKTAAVLPTPTADATAESEMGQIVRLSSMAANVAASTALFEADTELEKGKGVKQEDDEHRRNKKMKKSNDSQASLSLRKKSAKKREALLKLGKRVGRAPVDLEDDSVLALLPSSPISSSCATLPYAIQ